MQVGLPEPGLQGSRETSAAPLRPVDSPSNVRTGDDTGLTVHLQNAWRNGC